MIHLINAFYKYAQKIEYSKEQLQFGIDVFRNTIINTISEYDNANPIVNHLPKKIADKLLSKKEYINALAHWVRDNIKTKEIACDLKDPFKVIYSEKDENLFDSKSKRITTIYKLLNKVILSEVKSSDDIKQILIDTDISVAIFVQDLGKVLGDQFGLAASELITSEDINKEEIKEHAGDAVVEQYKELNKSKSDESCMTKRPHLLKLYVQNPDKVKLIRYLGVRFLLWTADDGQIILDRIYPDQHKLIPKILSWARNNNILTKTNPTAYDSKKDFTDGSTRFVTLSIDDISLFPYLDTFTFGKVDIDNNIVILSNKLNKETGFIIEFDETNGGVEVDDKRYKSLAIYLANKDKAQAQAKCSSCDDLIDTSDEASYATLPDGDIVCEECFNEHFFTCYKCDEIDNNGNSVYSEITEQQYCSDCWNRLFAVCDGRGCDAELVRREAKEFNNDYYCDDCFNENFFICYKCDDAYRIEDSTSDDDGDQFCEECYDLTYVKCAKCSDELSAELSRNEFKVIDNEPFCLECAKELEPDPDTD